MIYKELTYCAIKPLWTSGEEIAPRKKLSHAAIDVNKKESAGFRVENMAIVKSRRGKR
jgi:hypothetical protein